MRLAALAVFLSVAVAPAKRWSRSGWKTCNGWVALDPATRCGKESDEGIPARLICGQCKNVSAALAARPEAKRPPAAAAQRPPTGQPAPCAQDERERRCAFEWVPLASPEEWKLYWPNKADRCQMLATDADAQKRCSNKTSLIRGYACEMDHDGLYLPFRERLHLRTRPKRLPGNRSTQAELGARIGDRVLLYLGDSVSNEMKSLLLQRNEDLKRLEPGGGRINFQRIPDADRIFSAVAYATDEDRDLARYESLMEAFMDAQTVDVVYIFNVGLHDEGHKDDYWRTLRALFPILDRLGGKEAYALGARLRPMFLDSSIQHFYSVDGGYTTPRLDYEGLATFRDGDCPRGLDRAAALLARPGDKRLSYRCAPSYLRAEYTKCPTFGGSHINKIARFEWERGNFTNLRFLPFGAATDALWDVHIGMSKQDCSHFCFFPALAELWSYIVLKAVEAVDSGATAAFDAWDWVDGA